MNLELSRTFLEFYLSETSNTLLKKVPFQNKHVLIIILRAFLTDLHHF